MSMSSKLNRNGSTVHKRTSTQPETGEVSAGNSVPDQTIRLRAYAANFFERRFWPTSVFFRAQLSLAEFKSRLKWGANRDSERLRVFDNSCD